MTLFCWHHWHRDGLERKLIKKWFRQPEWRYGYVEFCYKCGDEIWVPIK